MGFPRLPNTHCQRKPKQAQSLTYMLAIHVVVEAEAVGGVGGDCPIGVFGSHAEGGAQEPGFVPVDPRARRLDVHVKTCGGEK